MRFPPPAGTASAPVNRDASRRRPRPDRTGRIIGISARIGQRSYIKDFVLRCDSRRARCGGLRFANPPCGLLRCYASTESKFSLLRVGECDADLVVVVNISQHAQEHSLFVDRDVVNAEEVMKLLCPLYDLRHIDRHIERLRG